MKAKLLKVLLALVMAVGIATAFSEKGEAQMTDRVLAFYYTDTTPFTGKYGHTYKNITFNKGYYLKTVNKVVVSTNFWTKVQKYRHDHVYVTY